MKLIDARCKSCATIRRDTLQRDSGAIEPCRACGADMERLAISEGQSAPPNVSPDDIPGGYVVHHGICNEDGTPRRYYSYSEMEREAKKRGLVQMVEHVPPEDTDKSEHTQRFVGLPASLSAEDEAARVAA